MPDKSTSVTEKVFWEEIEGKEVRDVAVSARESHIDVVLDDGEPFTTITVRGDNLSWEVSEVRELGTDIEDGGGDDK